MGFSSIVFFKALKIPLITKWSAKRAKSNHYAIFFRPFYIILSIVIAQKLS